MWCKPPTPQGDTGSEGRPHNCQPLTAEGGLCGTSVYQLFLSVLMWVISSAVWGIGVVQLVSVFFSQRMDPWGATCVCVRMHVFVYVLYIEVSLLAQAVKNLPCNAGDLGSISGLGRSPGGEHGNPLEYSCLKNREGQRSLAGYSPWGHKEPDTTEWLSVHPHTHIHVCVYTCVYMYVCVCINFHRHGRRKKSATSYCDHLDLAIYNTEFLILIILNLKNDM